MTMLRFNRFQIITDNHGNKRLQLYFHKTVPKNLRNNFATNTIYDILLKRLDVSWYDYILDENWNVKGVNLLMVDNNIADTPSKKSDDDLSTLADLLIKLKMITPESAHELKKYHSTTPDRDDQNTGQNDTNFPQCRIGGRKVLWLHYRFMVPVTKKIEIKNEQEDAYLSNRATLARVTPVRSEPRYKALTNISQTTTYAGIHYFFRFNNFIQMLISDIINHLTAAIENIDQENKPTNSVSYRK